MLKVHQSIQTMQQTFDAATLSALELDLFYPIPPEQHFRAPTCNHLFEQTSIIATVVRAGYEPRILRAAINLELICISQKVKCLRLSSKGDEAVMREVAPLLWRWKFWQHQNLILTLEDHTLYHLALEAKEPHPIDYYLKEFAPHRFPVHHGLLAINYDNRLKPNEHGGLKWIKEPSTSQLETAKAQADFQELESACQSSPVSSAPITIC